MAGRKKHRRVVSREFYREKARHDRLLADAAYERAAYGMSDLWIRKFLREAAPLGGGDDSQQPEMVQRAFKFE